MNQYSLCAVKSKFEMVLKYAHDIASLLNGSIKHVTYAFLVSKVRQKNSSDSDLSINSEVFNTINFTVFGLHKLLLHPLEVSLSGLCACGFLLLVSVADWLGKLVCESIEALYVCLDHFKLLQTLILRKLRVLVLTSATGAARF